MPVCPYIKLCGNRWGTWTITYKPRSCRILEKRSKIFKSSSYLLQHATWIYHCTKMIMKTVNFIFFNANTHNHLKKVLHEMYTEDEPNNITYYSFVRRTTSIFLKGVKLRGVKLTTRLRPVTNFWMSGAMPLLPHVFIVWYLLKQRGSATFYSGPVPVWTYNFLISHELPNDDWTTFLFCLHNAGSQTSVASAVTAFIAYVMLNRCYAVNVGYPFVLLQETEGTGLLHNCSRKQLF
jgi:hypothetical protein